MTAPVLSDVLADLTAEGDDLDALVGGDPASWDTPTPAAGWTVGHQIGHLAWTDEVALLAATDPGAFGSALAGAGADPVGYVDVVAAERAALPATDMLRAWRTGRATLRDALLAVPPGTKLPWFGPPMSATSMATARIMETWAHGQDIADTLGVPHAPTARLRHVAHLGVRTRDFAYLLRDRTPPTAPFRVELTAPDGSGRWTWGPEDAEDRVTGPALDFCLLVTQRRHRDDLAVEAEGRDADAWLDIAQAFAGVPGPGRAPAGVSA